MTTHVTFNAHPHVEALAPRGTRVQAVAEGHRLVRLGGTPGAQGE
jgi:hypothetical protein